ncbi:MAG: hypothetical protein GY807_00020 [Gammaproteobacteria bacterium]|nr:hypothetical protein [Gammaproteobacteria bacterium]
MAKRITLSELRQMIRDLDVTDEEIASYLSIDSSNSTAYAPALKINPKAVDDEGLEGDVAMAFFNHWDRRRRQRRYRRKIGAGWNGLKIVSEGDSWFQYPFLLRDVIDHLFDDYAIFSLGAAGDLVSDMQQQDEVKDAVRQHQPHLFLISGGGNDLLGGGRIKTALHPFDTSRPPQDYPNDTFTQRLREVIDAYRTLFGDLLAEFPGLKIICHGYDYALPDKGRWLGKPMESIGIKDKALQADIIRELIDRFNRSLNNLAGEFTGSVFRADCLNAVAVGQWHDELHPDNDGYDNVADRFRTVINSIAGQTEAALDGIAPLCPGKEASIKDARDLEPKAFRELVDHRAREILSVPLPTTSDENRRREIENEISQHFEKISGGADFLPASFLRDGAGNAAAVCRINLPSGSGTGFLIATRNFIMTNNHVIGSVDEAESAVAEFRFEEGEDSIQVNLDPQQFFITSADLDFTIVGCDGSALSDINPIPLLRSPSTVTRREQVNIVQHPRGRQKEVALHNNEVSRVKDKVVWYTTDTEPGSSGSPVFNNSWDLVALHHAGWNNGDGKATNEGIRIAAIVSHLLARQHSEVGASNELYDLIGTIPDSSPHLGFFDIAGITGTNLLEVELPEYRGSTDFADIGFWNIEHFNNSITNKRIEKVAGVLSHLSLDVMGLIEVERQAMDRLVSALQALGYAYAYKYLNVRGRQDLAVLYDTNTSDVRLATDILNRHGNAWNAETTSGRTAFPRRPLIARVKVAPRVDGNGNNDDSRSVEFIMISVHLKAFGDPESRARRKLAAEILSEVISDIRETERLPVVLGGDLNETLSTDVLDALTDAPDLFTLTSDDADDNALSYVGANHRSLIDHIIVSDDVIMSPISGDDAAIVRLDKSVGDFTRDISDHVPLVIRMVNRTAPLQVDDLVIPKDDVLRLPVPAGAQTIGIEFK